VYRLRPASQADQRAIRALIASEQLNPFSLDWRRFVIAVDPGGEMIGCGQVKPHGDGSFELASVAVLPAWRGQGVAGAIIEHLLASQPGPVFLTCADRLENFYRRFGFRIVGRNEMTPYFRRLASLAGVFLRLARRPEKLLVMRRDGPA
jgi:N-acetylglutamate synthase-like GNAT family acetyltransferase